MSLIAQWDTYDQFRNVRTGQHSVEIIDQQGGTNGTFSIDFNNGFVLNTGGKPKDLHPGIQPATCTFQMKVETVTHENFIKSIAKSRDISRFIVVYKRWSRVVFVGVIIPRAISYRKSVDFFQDGGRKKNGVFTVTAVDGITTLQNVTFLFGLTARRDPFIRWIREAFEKMPTFSYLGNQPFLFQTSWVPDTGTANFVLNQSVESRTFMESVNRLGGSKSPTQWDVLDLFCKTFNIRLRSAYGFYFFQQLEDISAPAYIYDKGGNFIGSTNLTTNVQDIDIDFLSLRDPEVYTYSPPILESSVDYNFGFNPNLADGRKFDSNVYAETCYNDINLLNIKNSESRIRVIGSIEYTPTITGSFSGQLRPVFWFKIKVGSQYFARELVEPTNFFQSAYKAEEWTTTVSKYYEIPNSFITLPDSNNKKFFHPVYFSTLRLDPALDNEQLSICFGHEVYDKDNNKIFESEVVTIAILDDLDMTLIDLENNVVEKTQLQVRIVNPAPNEIKVHRDITFSSGPNEGSANRITDDSTPPVSTINWSAPGLGSGLHYEILAKSLMARGIEMQEWMETVVEGAYQDLVPLHACGATWVWWTGRYVIDQHQEWHKGEFLQVKVDPVNLLAEKQDVFDVVERPTISTPGGGGDAGIVEKEITGITTNRINADTHKIPMPDTTNWSHEQIRNIVQYNQGGNIRKYTVNPTIENEFMFDSVTRDFVLGENTRANLWHIFRVHTGR